MNIQERGNLLVACTMGCQGQLRVVGRRTRGGATAGEDAGERRENLESEEEEADDPTVDGHFNNTPCHTGT